MNSHTKNKDSEVVDRLLQVKPHARQVRWQETEFYAFIHFNINTFTGNQWGDGTESAHWFDPLKLDTEQWVKTIKEAGMKGLIITCKHHDGFCLWPSRFTDHSVMSSPWKKGKGDLIREVSESCAEHGLKFGIYLSPWDRHESSYGYTDAYNDFFVNQLTELLTEYGEIFSVWLDGACGEGKNGKQQVYDWKRYYSVIRRYQPDACISVCGPDVRWCGNESGLTRQEEWSVVPKSLQDVEKIQTASQKNDNHQKFIHLHSSSDKVLGNREILRDEKDLIWYPCEVNTSIRPSWFYSEAEDSMVKSADELFDLYSRSVGGNSTLLLNIPPDKNGLIHKNDAAVLLELGNKIKQAFSDDKVEIIKDVLSGEKIEETIQEDEIYKIDIFLKDKTIVNCVEFQEDISKGQRVEEFSVELLQNKKWKTVFKGKTIGYKKIARFPEEETDTLRLSISKCRGIPNIESTRVFQIS